MVKNPTRDARDTGSIPGPGRFHTPQSPAKPVGRNYRSPPALEPVLHDKRGHGNEKSVRQNQRGASTLHNKSRAHTPGKTQPSQK